MTTVADVVGVMQQLAPTELAESWDNVGLLIGDRTARVERALTCLTVTPDVVAEAIEAQASLLVSHHPLPFDPLRSITADTTVGRMLLDLIRHEIAVYSAHTAFDSARAGINQHLAIGLDLQQIAPLTPSADDPEVGAGRFGDVSEGLTLRELAQRAKAFLGLDSARIVGPEDAAVSRVAVACGSGGSLLGAAVSAGCNGFVTGEATFHSCLSAAAADVGLVLLGHFASERFAMESLADYLGDQLAGIKVQPSRRDSDPFQRV
ncbi:MAG: Nif3-like dinuclear metal center hexameric protein [Planctomycetaceae bacterium]|nr:Nif3-like dinuclear metal center hexameric protein [Planctomycetaceae bacterium]